MAEYSHSKLNTYRSCPRKYKLQYIDRIADTQEGIEAFMGSRVHEVLERLYRSVAKCHRVTLEEALELYDASWERNWHDEVKVVRAEFSAADYRETGRSCIRHYWRRYEPFDQGVVVGVERRVRAELDESRGIVLSGIIDRLDRVADGVYEIHDYKTSSALPEQAAADADPQLALYQLAVERMWPDVREVTLVWHYLAFDAEIRSRRDAESLDELRADTLALIERIEVDCDFGATESALCDWCGYGALCPRRQHGIAVAKLPPREFEADEGVKLVNEYVTLTEQKADLEELIGGAREALIVFAQAQGLEVVVGGDHCVTVKSVPQLTVPCKGSEERTRLEEALRSLDLWDEVSCLDTSSLIKAVNNARWDKSALASVAQFLHESARWRVTKSHVRGGRESD